MASEISLSVMPKNDSYDEEITRIMELPKELLTDIICRLPISSLYKMMKPLLLHNKEFHSIISDPKFPQLYQTYDNIHPYSFIAYTSSLYDTRMSLVEYDSNRNDFIITRLNMEFVPAFSRKDMMMQSLEVLASCNGWLLVRLWWYDDHYYYRAHDVTNMFLVNPITRRYLTIPQITGLSTTERLERYAFGYVPKIGKYKVVRILEKSYEVLTINDDDKFECTNWRKRIISQDHPLYREYTKNDIIHKFKNPVVWEGSLYCLVDEDTKILKLDMEKEEIELVSPPSIVLDSGFCGGFLGVLGESLYIGINRFRKGVEVWVMVQKHDNGVTWKKAFVIGESQCKFDQPFEIIRVYDEGKILIYSSFSKKLYLLDPKDERSEEKSIEIQGMDFMDVIKFVPSFLPLKHV